MTNFLKKQNLVILIYMTLECNLRCYYCVVNFKKEYISFNTIDDILFFLSKNRDRFGSIFVEFFGGEPLLVFDKIKYFVDNSKNMNIKYKITTNGTLLNKEILSYFNQYFTSVYISFSNLNILNIKNLYNIFKLIGKENINKYSITFIYHPSFCFKEHIKYLNLIIGIGYKNINILPIYMYKSYDLNEFKNFEIFLKYIKTKTDISFEYLYFVSNKSDLEFSILPNGDCSLDSGETIYDMKNYSSDDLKLGNVIDLQYDFLIKKINNFDLNKYVKDFFSLGLVNQSYENFLRLSDILKENK